MESERTEWINWAHFLRRHGLTEFALWCFEAGNPFSIIGAQFFYMSQPFLRTPHVQAFAEMLENNEESQAFADFLRREISA